MVPHHLTDGGHHLDREPLHLFVATPCYGGMVHQRYMQSICELLLVAQKDGSQVSVHLLGNDSLITRARNTLVSMFLDSDATHLLFIDADIGFAPTEVVRLLRLDQDVAAGSYPLKIVHTGPEVVDHVRSGETLSTAVLRYVGAPSEVEARQEKDGFVTAEYAGTGFMMIRREALERMIAAYPETRFSAAHDRSEPNPSANLYALFDCMIDPDTGEYLSEDYTFCRRWRDIGGEVWLDMNSRLHHTGPWEFAGDRSLRAA
jgi:glycosyltransferase involved in cell wall biosynthesis